MLPKSDVSPTTRMLSQLQNGRKRHNPYRYHCIIPGCEKHFRNHQGLIKHLRILHPTSQLQLVGPPSSPHSPPSPHVPTDVNGGLPVSLLDPIPHAGEIDLENRTPTPSDESSQIPQATNREFHPLINGE